MLWTEIIHRSSRTRPIWIGTKPLSNVFAPQPWKQTVNEYHSTISIKHELCVVLVGDLIPNHSTAIWGLIQGREGNIFMLVKSKSQPDTNRRRSGWKSLLLDTQHVKFSAGSKKSDTTENKHLADWLCHCLVCLNPTYFLPSLPHFCFRRKYRNILNQLIALKRFHNHFTLHQLQICKLTMGDEGLWETSSSGSLHCCILSCSWCRRARPAAMSLGTRSVS